MLDALSAVKMYTPITVLYFNVIFDDIFHIYQVFWFFSIFVTFGWNNSWSQSFKMTELVFRILQSPFIKLIVHVKWCTVCNYFKNFLLLCGFMMKWNKNIVFRHVNYHSTKTTANDVHHNEVLKHLNLILIILFLC